MEKAKEAGLEKDVEAAVERVEKGVEDKVEDGVKVALWDIYGPHPSLALVKFWQGVVELCLEITVIVLSLAVLVAASVSVSDVSIDTTGASSNVVDLVDDSRSAAGFMVFVGIFVILCEVAVIAVRFLNFGAINRFFLVFVIVALIMALVVGVFSFSGGIAAAVSGEDWQDRIDAWEDQGVVIYSRGHRIPRDLVATAAFGILTTVGLVLQSVWMVLYLVFDWNKHMPTASILGGVGAGVKREVKTIL